MSAFRVPFIRYKGWEGVANLSKRLHIETSLGYGCQIASTARIARCGGVQRLAGKVWRRFPRQFPVCCATFLSLVIPTAQEKYPKVPGSLFL